MQEDKNIKQEESLKPEWRDIVAIIIAQFQVLMPFMLILLGAFTIVLVLLMKFWVRP